MAVSLPPQPQVGISGKDPMNPLWIRWFNTLFQKVQGSGGSLFSALDFTGSDITSIATRNHNDLGAVQGGQASQYYHLTQVDNVALTGSGGVTAQSGVYQVLSTDRLILCNATGAGFQVTLPNAIGLQGKVYTILQTDASGNTVTIAPKTETPAQKINGSSTQTLSAQYKSYTVISDNANWWIIAST